jgi:hypothetical protein
MATKEFVGPVDCLGAALPDEEYFMLLARDPLAAGLTMIWASIRLGDARTAMDNFTRLAAPELMRHYMSHPDQAKAEEAVEVAQRMVAWRERNRGRGQDQPTWKKSRAAGVERFVLSYAERTPVGPHRVNVAFDNWPLWARTLRPPETEAAKIACGLRQVANDMMADQMDAMVNGQSADRINGFAAELEIIAGNPLSVGRPRHVVIEDDTPLPPAELAGDCA